MLEDLYTNQPGNRLERINETLESSGEKIIQVGSSLDAISESSDIDLLAIPQNGDNLKAKLSDLLDYRIDLHCYRDIEELVKISEFALLEADKIQRYKAFNFTDEELLFLEKNNEMVNSKEFNLLISLFSLDNLHKF